MFPPSCLQTVHSQPRSSCLYRGLDNAGKTTIVRGLNGEDTTTISPTLGFNIKTMQFKGYKLNIWDVGGQKTLRPYWRNYYEKTDGLIWVIDSADLARLEDTKTELHNLLHEERLFGATLLILANKQDIPAALSLQEIEQVLDLGSMAKRHCKAIACSAHTGDGLLEAFEWLVSDISSRIYLFGH
eukprot:GHUV01025628.1.p1 GENE.GHUV01025628.1~~GHUV01025628.1.p1  ORF type:complete len:185 (+),score=15.04 GHUV01025628.1:134-688(+)